MFAIAKTWSLRTRKAKGNLPRPLVLSELIRLVKTAVAENAAALLLRRTIRETKALPESKAEVDRKIVARAEAKTMYVIAGERTDTAPGVITASMSIRPTTREKGANPGVDHRRVETLVAGLTRVGSRTSLAVLLHPARTRPRKSHVKTGIVASIIRKANVIFTTINPLQRHLGKRNEARANLKRKSRETNGAGSLP